MTMNVQPRGARFQLRVTSKLLPKPFFATFPTDAEARAYGTSLEALLARGVVPSEMLAPPERSSNDPALTEVVLAYIDGAPVTDSDRELLTMMLTELAGVRISGLTYQWADAYVKRLKVKRNIKPSTIRKRVGAIGRVLDWHLRRATPAGEQPPPNVMRLLEPGYSLYARTDAAEIEAAGKEMKRDEARKQRLAPEHEHRVLVALGGEKRPDRERALAVDPAFELLFRLIVDTGLRLREAYRLRVNQIDFAKRIIHVEGTKGHRGEIKPRTVPLKPQLYERLHAYCQGRVGLIFPFWDGNASPVSLRRATSKLSVRFSVLFAYANVPAFTEHDLRHEATCRWVELRNSRGNWAFSDIEICKIMGWSSTDMMLTYASLRGEDLAARML